MQPPPDRRFALIVAPDATGSFALSAWVQTLSAAGVLEVVCVPDDLPAAQAICRDRAGRWPSAVLDDALAEHEFDLAVVIALQPDREPLVRPLLAARRHVLVAGLPVLRVAEANKLIAAAEKTSRRVFVGLPSRFAPAVAKARDLIYGGRVGPLASCTLAAVMAEEPSDPDLAVDVDALADIVAMLIGLTGPPAEVLARQSTLGTLGCLMTTADGVLVSVHVQTTPHREQARSMLELCFQDGARIQIADHCQLTAETGVATIARHTPRVATWTTARVELGYAALLADAVRAISHARASPSPAELANTLDSWLAVDAIRKSAGSGRAVSVQ